jgi:hypothetical protein
MLPKDVGLLAAGLVVVGAPAVLVVAAPPDVDSMPPCTVAGTTVCALLAADLKAAKVSFACC